MGAFRADLVSLCLAVAARSGAESCLTAQAPLPAGASPQAIVAPDLDRSQGPDVAIANQSGNDISVRLNNGDGTFGAELRYPTGNGPFSIVAADLDGINGPDLVTANETSGDLSVLMNLGDGTFAAAVSYPVGQSARAVAVGDFDQALGPDLAAASWQTGDLSVRLNNGDGTFSAPMVTLLSPGLHSMATADFDGVNGADLLVANEISNTLTAMLNRGGGSSWSFTFIPVDVDLRPWEVIAEDLDGRDGPDAAVACSDSDVVWVLLNPGNGVPMLDASYATGNQPYALAAADLDLCPGLELIVADSFGGTLSVLANQGSGRFGGRQTFAAGSYTNGVVAADFDRQGGPDVAATNGFSNDVSVYFNCSAAVGSWLLRNDDLTALDPPSTPLAAIFIGSGAVTLDLLGADGLPQPGEGRLEAAPGSRDDDDAYLCTPITGQLDPDASVLGDTRRKLVFYQASVAGGSLRLVKSGPGIRIEL